MLPEPVSKETIKADNVIYNTKLRVLYPCDIEGLERHWGIHLHQPSPRDLKSAEGF